jgi:hypothetical protein
MRRSCTTLNKPPVKFHIFCFNLHNNLRRTQYFIQDIIYHVIQEFIKIFILKIVNFTVELNDNIVKYKG